MSIVITIPDGCDNPYAISVKDGNGKILFVKGIELYADSESGDYKFSLKGPVLSVPDKLDDDLEI